MESFLTKEGRCVVEHGEIRLESIGYVGRVRRGLKNAVLAHRERYERGTLRFVAVLVFGLYGLGRLANEVYTGDWSLVALVTGIVVAFVVLVAGGRFLRQFVRRRFRGFTGARVIPLRAVESVDPHPKGWVTRPRFVVHYDEYGTEKKRYVGVCFLTPLAENEFETAKVVLLDECDLPITMG